ncbi:MAG TPA: DNA repair protein RecO [bacterium]|nr:DNA repair protein RecO [bacterium]
MRATRQTQALLLRSWDKGDDDRMAVLLTPELGRLPALARHARGSRRRFGATLQAFCLFDATLRPSSGGLFFLEQSQAREFPLGTEPGLEAMSAAWLALELAEQLCQQAQPQEAFFELILGTLRRLGRGAEQAAAVRLSLLWGALALEGWAPDPEHCARCGKAEPLAALSMAAGGGLCAGCWRSQDGPRYGAEVGRAWQLAAQGRPVELVPGGAEDALLRWIADHTGRELRSPAMHLEGTP